MRYILIFLIVCVLIVLGILLPALYEQQFIQKRIKVQSRLKTIYESVVVYHSIHNTYPDKNTCLEEFPVFEYYPWCFQRVVFKKGI